MTIRFAYLIALFFVFQGILHAQQPVRGKNLFQSHFNPIPLRAKDSQPSSFQLPRRDLQGYKRDSVQLYKAISLLEKGEAKLALPILLNLTQKMQYTVANASEWYLAMAYLALEKRPQAEYLLLKIADTEIHPYQDESEVVYQKLIGMRSR